MAHLLLFNDLALGELFLPNVETHMHKSATPEQPIGVRGLQPYLLAAVCVSVAFLLRLLVDPIWKERLPFGSFFLAVLVVTQFAGKGPSIFATVSGFLLADWFFVFPRYSLIIQGPLNQLNGALYFVVCYGALYFSTRMRRAIAAEKAAGTALGQLAQERERLVGELQKALSEVKTLSGFFPICAHCKKIRDDKGYWNQIEVYVRDHSNASFTHGICPECAHQNFGHLPPHIFTAAKSIQ
jgi:K+-sensing histidine kinase KdpD